MDLDLYTNFPRCDKMTKLYAEPIKKLMTLTLSMHCEHAGSFVLNCALWNFCCSRIDVFFPLCIYEYDFLREREGGIIFNF